VFVIPLIAAVVGAAFAVVVGRQYLKRRKPYQAIWALALGMFGVAAAFETAGQLAGWSDATYKGYYLFGGLLNVGWLGVGTVYLLAPRRAGHVAAVVMGLISLIHRGAHAAGLLLVAPLFVFLSPRTVFAGAAVAIPLVGVAGAISVRAAAARAGATAQSPRS